MSLRDFIKSSDEELALDAARRHISCKLPLHSQEIPRDEVPTELRSLMDVAELFGVEDDTVRQEAVLIMPESFRRRLSAHIDNLRDKVVDWLAEGEWTDTKSAYDALMQLFPEALPPAGSLRSSAEQEEAVSDIVRRLEQIRRR